MQLPRLRNIRCQMKNLNSVILSLNVKMQSFAKQMIFSRMQSVFSQKTGRSKDKRTSPVRQRIASQALVTNGLTQSLSGTAHCYDNARMESFFATLKKEKLYQIPTYRTKREEVKTVIFRYIFGYYNTQRIFSKR